MRIGIITSRGVIYPTLRYPQYLDQDNIFKSLASYAEVCLIGNIIENRPYACSQISYSRILKTLPLIWNNRWTTRHTNILVRKLKDKLDYVSDMFYSHFCLNFLNDCQVDCIYSFPWPFDRFIVKLAKKLDKPLIIEMWEDYACFSALNLGALMSKSAIDCEVDRIYSWMKDVSEGADRVIVPSLVFAERLEYLGVPGNKIRVIPVCMEDTQSSFLSIVSKEDDIGQNETMVFFIGGLAPWHDIQTLIKAAKYVNNNCVFIISGGSRRDIEELANKYEKGNVKINFTGRITEEELEVYLHRADICVAPYRFNKPSGFFPGKVIRYMLAGKAIVASDELEIREMFRGEEAGILIPPGDSKALASAIDELAARPDKRREMGLIAKGIAQNTYLTEHHTRDLINIIKEIT